MTVVLLVERGIAPAPPVMLGGAPRGVVLLRLGRGIGWVSLIGLLWSPKKGPRSSHTPPLAPPPIRVGLLRDRCGLAPARAPEDTDSIEELCSGSLSKDYGLRFFQRQGPF